MKTTIRVYRRNGWRWQMRDARNGRVIGASTEAYVRRAACIANLDRVTGLYCDFARGVDDEWTGELGMRMPV